jgi:hypothetical protein
MDSARKAAAESKKFAGFLKPSNAAAAEQPPTSASAPAPPSKRDISELDLLMPEMSFVPQASDTDSKKNAKTTTGKKPPKNSVAERVLKKSKQLAKE